MSTDCLADLVAAVVASPRDKYRHIHPDLIMSIGRRELAHRSSLKEAIKATKNKLHQIGTAYLDGTPDYSRWQHDLEATVGDSVARQATCQRIMQRHASTRDRLAFVAEFYALILADLPPIRSIMDLACGLNPLALSWMPLPPGFQYFAYDIFDDMVAFLNCFFATAGIAGQAQSCDLTASCPAHQVDLALILKTLPCLDQLDKTASRRLIERVNARSLVVSYPLTTLGGKRKGMESTYDAHFQTLLADKSWPVRRFVFPNELAFLIEKHGA